jgi:hypothetical protein
MDKHDFIKKQFEYREQQRWNLSDKDDAATLLMSLEELQWRYHHLAMLEYRNHKYTKFHDHWGCYWGIKLIRDVIFPYHNSKDTFSRILKDLDRRIEREDTVMLGRIRND